MTFAALFAQHWDAGTGRGHHKLPGRRAWSVKEFANSMSAGGCIVSEDAVGNWLNGVNTPRRPQAMAILDVFFGIGDESPDRQAMYEAWMAEQRPGARRERTTTSAEPPPPNAAEWHHDGTDPISGLAALELHTPQPDNSGGHHLRGRLTLGEREDDSTEHPVLISLREAYVSVETSAALTTDGSLIGVREEHENLKPVAGALRVTGPSATATNGDGSERRYLEGEVFGGTTIATLSLTANPGAAEVTVSLAIPRRVVQVTPIDENGAPVKDALDSVAKTAVMDAIIFNAPGLPKDDQGRAVIQRAKLKRVPKE